MNSRMFVLIITTWDDGTEIVCASDSIGKLKESAQEHYEWISPSHGTLVWDDNWCAEGGDEEGDLRFEIEGLLIV